VFEARHTPSRCINCTREGPPTPAAAKASQQKSKSNSSNTCGAGDDDRHRHSKMADSKQHEQQRKGFNSTPTALMAGGGREGQNMLT